MAAVPEGDTIHRAARRLQVLVGQRIDVESPHPRARAERVAERIDGRVLESVEALGKNLRLSLRRRRRAALAPAHVRSLDASLRRAARRTGKPWLVLRGERAEGVLWNGPVLELHTRAIARLGPDILERPPRLDAMLARLRAADQTRWFGETLLDQSLVAGIGNMWLAEALWRAELSPWRRLRAVLRGRSPPRARSGRGADARGGRRRPVAAAIRSTAASAGRARAVARRIRSWGQGDDNRMTYWCPGCQAGDDPPRV